jgi:hypothetical protein
MCFEIELRYSRVPALSPVFLWPSLHLSTIIVVEKQSPGLRLLYYDLPIGLFKMWAVNTKSAPIPETNTTIFSRLLIHFNCEGYGRVFVVYFDAPSLRFQ